MLKVQSYATDILPIAIRYGALFFATLSGKRTSAAQIQWHIFVYIGGYKPLVVCIELLYAMLKKPPHK